MPDFSLEGLDALMKGRLGKSQYSRQISAALTLAFHGHDGQFREQADSEAKSIPYIVHPVGVALLAKELLPKVEIQDEFDDVIASCLTHDLLEDTKVTPYDIESATSARTLQLVTALSKPSSTNYPSREERNNALLDTIKSAGKTAVFIKICDSLHNLSRPEQTPLGLLKKTVKKGRDQYLDLLESGDLGADFRAYYQARLDEVDTLVSQARFESLVGVGNDDLDAVFAYCRERTKRKVLETHDVVDILKEITGANDVLYTSIRDIQNNFEFEKTDTDFRDLSNALNDISESGEISIDVWPDRARKRLSSAKKILVIKPKGLDKGGKFFLVLLVPKAPSWISGAILTVLVSYLLERLMLHEADWFAELANQLQTHRLMLDPNLAIEAGLTLTNVKDLARHLEAAAVASSILDTILLHHFPQNMETRIERRESRIKDASSITRKMISKELELDDIEDVIGYRFVVGNLNDREKLTHYLNKRILDYNVTDGKPPILKSLRTSKGYVANHIFFTMKPEKLFDVAITVEVQVRTILDDAWARISQSIDYKKNNVIVKKNERNLKKIRKMIDEIEKDI